MDTPKKTDTLVFAEARWKPVVIAVFVTCASCSVVLAMQGAWWTSVAGVLGMVACLALIVSNAVHLAIDGTTFGMIPVSVAALGLAGAAVGNKPFDELGLTVGALLVCGFALLRSAYSSHPAVSDHATLVVLGCAVENGRPSKTLESRLERALSILSSHPSVNAVVTGGPVAGSTLTEADVMAEWLVAHGVEPTRVFLERRARNTDENLELSLALIDELGFGDDEVAVVSSDYHLWRARHAARRLVGDSPAPLVMVAAPTPLASRLQQWSREVLVVVKDFFA